MVGLFAVDGAGCQESAVDGAVGVEASDVAVADGVSQSIVNVVQCGCAVCSASVACLVVCCAEFDVGTHVHVAGVGCVANRVLSL